MSIQQEKHSKHEIISGVSELIEEDDFIRLKLEIYKLTNVLRRLSMGPNC